MSAEICSYIRLKRYADFYLQISAGRSIQKSSLRNNYRFLQNFFEDFLQKTSSWGNSNKMEVFLYKSDKKCGRNVFTKILKTLKWYIITQTNLYVITQSILIQSKKFKILRRFKTRAPNAHEDLGPFSAQSNFEFTEALEAFMNPTG